MKQVADWQAREQAIDVTRSFSVVAPAGSGKTELLTQRLLALLATVDQPEEVMAITFTRKAAEEMTARLLKAMHSARQEPTDMLEPHEAKTRALAQAVLARDAHCGWQLLKNPNRLRLKTIDGLCASITQQLPIEARFGAALAVADNPDELYADAIQQMLQELRKSTPLADHIANVLGLLDNRLDAFENLMCGLLAKRDQWLKWIFTQADHEHFLVQLQQDVDALNESRLSRLASAICPHASQLCILLDFAATQLPADHPLCALKGITELPTANSDGLCKWKIIVDQCLTGTGTLRKTVDRRNGFPTSKEAVDKAQGELFSTQKAAMVTMLGNMAAQPELLEAMQRCRELVHPDAVLAHGNAINAIMQMLPHSVAYLWTVFSQRGQVDYIEINRAANMALNMEDSPTDVALRLDYQIRHILVDEFQDTSPPQLALLESLTAGWEPGDGRTLFIVGDGMQSCYGFREANVGIFLNACEHGVGHVRLEPLQLEVNFRSQEGIIDWVNDCFEKAFPSQHDASAGAVAFARAIAQKPMLEDAATQCFALLEDDDGSAEARQVVAIIEAIRQAFPEESIAILVRARTHLESILVALQEAGIPWLAEDIDPLASRGAIRDLINLYSALYEPANALAWAALLRSPLVGLRLDDLLVLTEPTDNDNLTLGECIVTQTFRSKPLSDEAIERLLALSDVLGTSYQMRARFSTRETLYRAWCSLSGPQLIANDGDSVARDVSRFLECLESLQHTVGGKHLSVERIETALKKLYASADTSHLNAVHVMTIHKSKGLEFDHVLIPGLDRKPKNPDPALVQWRHFEFDHGKAGFLLAPMANNKSDNGLYQLLAAEQKRKEQLESTRLLYVGVTRAIKRLYLLARVSADKKGLKAPNSSSLLADIWPTFETQAQLIEPDVVNALPLDDRLNARASIDARNRRILAMATTATTSSCWLPGNGATNIPRLEGDSTAQSIGNMVHRVLELLNKEHVLAWQVRTDRIEVLKMIAQDLAIPMAEHAELFPHVDWHVCQVAEDTSNHWIFSAQKEHREWRLVDSSGRLSVIDRVIWHESGEVTIIDYKTALPTANEATDEFIKRELAQYREQLEHYRDLMQSLGMTIRETGLYFTGLQQWAPLL